jgi:hypothetical protein
LRPICIDAMFRFVLLIEKVEANKNNMFRLLEARIEFLVDSGVAGCCS